MTVPQRSSISSDVDANWLMHVDNVVSKEDSSKSRRSLLPSLQIKPFRVRHMSGKNYSNQHGNDSACLFRSYLFRVEYSFGMLFDIEAWLPRAWLL